MPWITTTFLPWVVYVKMESQFTVPIVRIRRAIGRPICIGIEFLPGWAQVSRSHASPLRMLPCPVVSDVGLFARVPMKAALRELLSTSGATVVRLAYLEAKSMLTVKKPANLFDKRRMLPLGTADSTGRTMRTRIYSEF